MTVFTSRDDGRHQPGDDPEWSEAWLFDVVQPKDGLGASFGLTVHPNRSEVSFHASVVGKDRELVSLVEPAAPMPAAPSLEVRAPALWTEIGFQTPMVHVTVDLEAFAVALSDPNEVFRGAYGTRLALGCELEWEMDGDLEPGNNECSYELPCRVTGELLIAHETIEIDGWGWRSHRWGAERTTDYVALRGRRADHTWWKQAAHPLEDLQTVGRAPVPSSVAGRQARLDQRLVTRSDGALAWVRSISV